MAQWTIQQAIEFAMQHQGAGRLAQAESIYRQVLAIDPAQPDALHLLGIACLQAGKADQAQDLIRKAIAARPDAGEYRTNLGLVLASVGRTEEAIESYRKALSLDPNLADAHNNLGNALLAVGQVQAAIESIHGALLLRPEFPEAQINLANALQRISRLDEAIALYRHALAARPDLPEAHYNLGLALQAKGELDEALAAVKRAIALRPDDPDAHNNLGHVVQNLGRLDEAEAAFRKAIALRPDKAIAHFNLGCLLLLRGDFEHGWPEQHWRWGVNELCLPVFSFTQPRWDGTDLNGKRILLRCEQGFGDTIQFARYAPLVAARGGRVILVCHPPLKRLLPGLGDVEQLITPDDPLPDFDVYSPLADLPMLFKTDLANIPARVPYLDADPELSATWQERVASTGAGLKVGLAWAGRPEHRNDRNRSMPLRLLEPLAQLPGVNLFSLQMGPAAEQARRDPSLMRLTDWTNELTDFADTAALVHHLDLVVTVDTAVAHLAGAMGKPVWVMLPLVPDWRWLLDREDSPWYPTMRLFRQSTFGQWDQLVRRVRDALAAYAAEKNKRS